MAKPDYPSVILTREDVITNPDGSWFLPISLLGLSIELPLKQIETPDGSKYLAWIDPSQPKVAALGAQFIASQLEQISNLSLVIQPPSSKSQDMITQAVNLLSNPPELITLSGGREPEFRLTSADIVQPYIPITGGKKYVVASSELVLQIRAAISQGKQIAIVDDVYSSGATVAAIRELLAKIIDNSEFNPTDISVVVLALEVLETEMNVAIQRAIGLAVHASFVIPVLVGEL